MTPLSTGLGDYVRLLLVLCGVLFLAIVVVRYWIPRMTTWNRSIPGPIRVISSIPLEARKTLYVIKAGKSFLLIATSEAGVSYLTNLDGEEFAALEQSAPVSQEEGRFVRLLRKPGLR